MRNLTKALLAVTAIASGSAHAVPVTINYTADNEILDFGICANPGCEPLQNASGFSTLLPKGSNVSNWTNADSVTFDLAAGTYDIGFVVRNYGTGSSGNPAGLLAEILWEGNSNLSSSNWEVSTTDIDWNPTPYVAATEWAQNGTGIWGGHLLGEIDSGAQWIWTANNFNSSTEHVVSFRTSITIDGATAVSEPGSLALLGLGLFGLGFARKRAAK